MKYDRALWVSLAWYGAFILAAIVFRVVAGC